MWEEVSLWFPLVLLSLFVMTFKQPCDAAVTNNLPIFQVRPVRPKGDKSLVKGTIQ